MLRSHSPCLHRCLECFEPCESVGMYESPVNKYTRGSNRSSYVIFGFSVLA